MLAFLYLLLTVYLFLLLFLMSRSSSACPPTPTEPLSTRLTRRFAFWQTITSDATVLSIVGRGLRVLLHMRPHYTRHCPLFRGTPQQMTALADQIAEWLRDGVIEPVVSGPHLLSLLFPVPKSDGRWRFCLDLRRTNDLTTAPKMRLPGVRQARQVLPQGCWFVRLDLTSAYSHVLMHKSARRLLAFAALGRRWRFKAMPFGLSTAPAFFTRLLRPVATQLQLWGIRLLRYLDDFLIWADLRDDCWRSARRAVRFLKRLGFKINWEKSCLEPTQEIVYLGFLWCSVTMTIHPLTEKLRDVRRQARAVLRLEADNVLTTRRLAALVGKVVALMPALAVANFRRHSLQRCVSYALRTTGSWDSYVSLSATARRDARWLTTGAAAAHARTGRPWRSARPRLVLTTDASPSGWGAWITARGAVTTARGDWHPQWVASSNLRETTAVTTAFFALQHLIPDGSDLLVRSDNTTAVSALRRAGARVRAIGEAIEPLLRAATRRSITLHSEHLPGADNSLADRLSRFTMLRSDWGLSRAGWLRLLLWWPCLAHLTIDLFASSKHHLLLRYATTEYDPHATAIDAFTMEWRHELPFLAPPIALIEPTIGRLLDDAPLLCLLLTPSWPSACWWPTATRMATATLDLDHADIRPPSAPMLVRGPQPTMRAWLLRPRRV